MILRIKVEKEAKRQKVVPPSIPSSCSELIIQAFDYPNALVVCQRGPIACVANAERYDLMDLERGERIPLFPIMQNADFSEDDVASGGATTKLHPLMISVGEDDFLVTTGTTMTDPAIGMFVNLNGDPVRGTLMFSTYPRAMSSLPRQNSL